MSLFGRGRHAQQEEIEPQRPAPPSPAPEAVSFDTVLGPGSIMKGDLYTPGSVRLEGTFEGSLQIDGNALVGENARVIANITAGNNVTIAGAVRGNVSGQRVQLLRTGRVWGDIEATSISTEEGAFIQGTITMRGGKVPPEFEDLAAAGEPVEVEAEMEAEPLVIATEDPEAFFPAEPLEEAASFIEESEAFAAEPGETIEPGGDASEDQDASADLPLN